MLSFIKVNLISFEQDCGGVFEHLFAEAFVSALVLLQVELKILGLHLLRCLGDVVQTVLEVVKVG